jgi:hypothetical protein
MMFLQIPERIQKSSRTGSWKDYSPGKKSLMPVIVILLLITTHSIGQTIDFAQFKRGDAVETNYYSLFGLDTYFLGKDNGRSYNYYVRYVGNIQKCRLICFVRTLPPNPVTFEESLAIVLIKDDKVVHKLNLNYERQGSPEFDVFDNTFIQYIERKHVWSEDEAGAMSFDPAQDFVDGFRFVVKDNKIIPLSKLSKGDLKIYKNLILAKHGFVFKSDDLRAYFKATDWYIPDPGVNMDQVLSEKDKELLDYFLKLQSNSVKK